MKMRTKMRMKMIMNMNMKMNLKMMKIIMKMNMKMKIKMIMKMNQWIKTKKKQIIKGKNNLLDDIIDKSKSFEEQTKLLKKEKI